MLYIVHVRRSYMSFRLSKYVKSIMSMNVNQIYKKYHVVGGRGRGGFVKNIMSF